MSLPDVLNVKPLNAIETMNIETSQLDPIVINQNLCRFVLERKGILDVGSVITMSVHPTDDTADKKCFLPIKTGCHALVKKALLKVGTKVLATSDMYGTHQTIRRAFKTNEEKSQKDFVKNGTHDVFEPDNAGVGKYQMKDVIYAAAGTAGTIDPSVQITVSETECPVFSIRLSDLFPMMRNVQLPLYLMNEPVSIEITWNTQTDGAASLGKMLSFQSGFAGTTGAKIGTDNVKFLADYLTYEDERMSQTAKLVNSDTGLVMPYEDMIVTNTNVPAVAPAPTGTTVSTQHITRDLGLSGRNVRQILVHDRPQIGGGVAANTLLGQYNSAAFNVPDSYNWRINDQTVYSREVRLEARKSNQLSHCFGTPINCLSAEYSTDPLTNKQAANQPINNDVVSASTFEGLVMTAVQGQMHFEGVDLSTSPLNIPNSGIKVGQKPVEHLRTIYRTAQNNSPRVLTYFSTVERAFVLRNGLISVSA
tara:strand:+ start:12 stop:1445 length:1434 start_codon:yes stop_codon:yes gene_type:complete